MAGRFGPLVVQKAPGTHSATVILLHGLGDTGNGWAHVGPKLKLNHVKFVYPTAPTRAITINAGNQMPGWFDLRGIEFGRVDPSRFDHQGIQESVDYVGSLIQQEVEAGIPANRIVVGGFSQGGHIAFKTLLAARRALAGCIALSTWLEPTFQAQVADEVKRVPVFIGHGSADPLVPAFLASTSQSTLQARGFSNVSMHVYPGLAHSSCAQEIDEARDFLLKVIPDKPPPTAAEVEQMSVKQLKEFLRSRHINTSTMLEKTELVARAKAECGSN